MSSLTDRQRALLTQLAAQLAAVPGVRAVVLGGSHARGRARADSDLDIGLYYRDAARFRIEDVAAIARARNDAPDPVVAGFGAWGPWVDGGAWLTIEGQRVDVLWRSLDLVERTLGEAQAGRYQIDWAQQPPFGFFGPTLLGEVAIAQPLADPHGEVAALKAGVSPYPPALRAAVVQNALWGVAFGLQAFAPKFARNGDAYGVAGCLARFANQLVLALFALNDAWLVNDKTALAEIAGFARAPAAFAARLSTILAAPGDTPETLAAAVASMDELFADVAALAGDAYRPAWRL